MIDHVRFLAGLAMLGKLCRFDAEPDIQAVYFEELEHETGPAEWAEFARWAARRGMYQGRCPSLHELTEGLREMRLERPRGPNPFAQLPSGEPAGMSKEEAVAAMRAISDSIRARSPRSGGWRRVFDSPAPSAPHNRGEGSNRGEGRS